MCAAPVVIPRTWKGSPAFSPRPVRIFSYIAADGSGVENHDFLAPEPPRSCTISGSYNPNVAASALYRNEFEYRVFFNTEYPPVGSPQSPSRLLTIVAEDHGDSSINPHASIDVGYVATNGELSAQVPLHESSARDDVPVLLRVSVRGLFPGWLTAYTSMHLKCD
jgi:hypothetical protein